MSIMLSNYKRKYFHQLLANQISLNIENCSLGFI
jgi:hypothetical protein